MPSDTVAVPRWAVALVKYIAGGLLTSGFALVIGWVNKIDDRQTRIDHHLEATDKDVEFLKDRGCGRPSGDTR